MGIRNLAKRTRNTFKCVVHLQSVAGKTLFTITPVLLALLVYSTPCQAENPFVQTCFTADPAPIVYDSTVFVYLGHDSSGAPAGTYLMRDWKCYSSKDMVNWTDHGVVLRSKDISWSALDANAAQVIERNGKFYYYISTTASGTVAIGVAVASSPTGPFVDIGAPLIAGSKMTGCNATHSWRGLDPTVFIDDDGQAYLYWGNNVCYWIKLNEDMVSTSGSVGCLAQNDAAFGPDFEEAPWTYKRKSIYYLMYASEFPECIRYSTSTGPTGPWTYRGQVMAKQPNGVSNTIHPGVCDYLGKSYYFYHNAGLPGGGSYKRSACIEEFTYNADGTIPAIPETKGGIVTGIGHLNPYDTVQAETICWESGITTQQCSEGGLRVDSISNGDYIKVKSVDFGDNAGSFAARVASATSGGTIELRLDSETGTLVGSCKVAGTGGLQSWVTDTCSISGATGIHDLFLKFTGGSGNLFTFNWWKFTPLTTATASLQGKIALHRSATIALRSYTRATSTLHVDLSPATLTQNVMVSLFTPAGRQAVTLFNGKAASLFLQLPLTKSVSPGVYLARVTANGACIQTKKITLP